MKATDFDCASRLLAWVMFRGGRRYEPPVRRLRVANPELVYSDREVASGVAARLRECGTVAICGVEYFKYRVRPVVAHRRLRGSHSYPQIVEQGWIVEGLRWGEPVWDALPVGT